MTKVLSLAPTPPANALVPESQLGWDEPRFPLDVHLCDGCGHLQLLDVVDPSALFEDYVYVSGTSPTFVKHFEIYAEEVIERSRLKAGDLVVEIGSNDGTLLSFFKQNGCRVLGIDPAKSIAEAATRNGIDTLPKFFTPEVAAEIRERHGRAAVVVANNVLAHIDDLGAVIDGVESLLTDDGMLVFEVSYLRDVYEKTLFDTIYHEHLDYHSVKPLVPFFRDHQMELFKAQRVSSHGGSLRGFVQRKVGSHDGDGSVVTLVRDEEELGLDRPGTFAAYEQKIEAIGERLTELLEELKAKGKTIAGYGAPAKATTLMHHFDLGAEVIDFIVDDAPLKQGLYTPGTHVPIVARATIEERDPDYLLILAWNFAEPIMSNERAFHERGGRFIVPLPEVEVR